MIMVKKKIKYPIFVFTLVIGVSVLAIGLLEPDIIFGQPIDLDISGLSLIDVPIDPTGGQILGTVKFGAPIVVPFERSGTVLSADGNCQSIIDINVPMGGSEVKFGRIVSGDPNAEVFFHSFNGLNCAYGYAEWDLTELPNDFVATGFTLQLNLKSIQSQSQSCKIGFVVDTFDSIGPSAIATRMVYGNNIGGTIPLQSSLGGPTPIDPITGEVVPHDFLVVGKFVVNNPKFDTDWCEKVGVKRWTFSKIEASGSTARLRSDIGVDTFNQQLQFNQLTQKGNDKFMLVFYGGANIGNAGPNVIDQLWWEENGSLLVTGASQPIRCGVGFEQVGFRCIPIICDITETLNLVTNECEAIVCDEGLVLEIKEVSTVCTTGIPPQCNSELIAICTKPNPCSNTEILVDEVCQPVSIIQPNICPDGTKIVGSDCEPLFCGEGFEIDGNQCTLKTCGIGTQLIDDQCQVITCQLNTILVGNDCMPRTCPAGQISVDNLCQNEDDIIGGSPTCSAGLKQLGDVCVPIDLNCPEGTEEFENVCVIRVPDLAFLSQGGLALDPATFVIGGILVSIMSVIGIIVRRI